MGRACFRYPDFLGASTRGVQGERGIQFQVLPPMVSPRFEPMPLSESLWSSAEEDAPGFLISRHVALGRLGALWRVSLFPRSDWPNDSSSRSRPAGCGECFRITTSADRSLGPVSVRPQRQHQGARVRELIKQGLGAAFETADGDVDSATD
jgi:hypothetical protein